MRQSTFLLVAMRSADVVQIKPLSFRKAEIDVVDFYSLAIPMRQSTFLLVAMRSADVVQIKPLSFRKAEIDVVDFYSLAIPMRQSACSASWPELAR